MVERGRWREGVVEGRAYGVLQREAQVEAHDILVDGAEARHVGEAHLHHARLTHLVRGWG